MFRVALSDNASLESVVLQILIQVIGEKTRSVLSRNLESQRALVIQFDRLQDLAAHLPGALST
jgi:hypothetical protein